MDIHKIYTLSNPTTNEVRYVGYTISDLNVRLNEHLRDKRINKRTSWIKSLLKQNLKPNIELLYIVDDNEWQFWEMFYISLFKSWGFKLTNMTDGGQAGPRLKGELNPFYGKKHSEETKQLLREKRKLQKDPKLGYKCNDEQKSRMSESQKKQIIIINNIKYSCLKEASNNLNIPSSTIHYRLKSNNYPNYVSNQLKSNI